MTSILFVGDVVGGLGRRTLLAILPELVDELQPTFVVVNGENAAGGLGITPRTAEDIFDAGADAITLGNHAYRHRDVYELLDTDDRILRPANYPKGNPGRGHTVVERDGRRLLEVQLDAARLDDAYYEVWLLEPSVEGLVPLGVTQPGRATFEIPAGLDLRRYPLVDVSVEPLDGDPAHSGDSVVRGELGT